MNILTYIQIYLQFLAVLILQNSFLDEQQEGRRLTAFLALWAISVG